MTQTTEIVKAKEFKLSQESITDARTALIAAKGVIEKATPVVNKIPEPTNEEEKAKTFKYRDRLKDQRDLLNEIRVPLTRKLTEMAKLFTGTEKEFDALIASVDGKLDAYAAKELAASRKDEDDRKAKLKAEQERIDAMSTLRGLLRIRIDKKLEEIQVICSRMTATITKDTLTEYKKKLSKDPVWNLDKFYESLPGGAEVAMFQEVLKEVKEEDKDRYLKEAKQLMADTVALLPVALKDAAEAKRIQDADEKRRAQEKEDAAAEETARVDGEKAMAHLDNLPDDQPSVKVKYEINVTSANAYLTMFAFWWEKETTENRSVDKVSRWTAARAKKFCEKYAFDHGTLIEHSGMEYVEVAKAKK